MKKAYLFSGQGSQYIGMHNLFKNYPEISNDFFIKSNQILGYNILDIISKGPNKTLNKTKYTQPAIFIISSIAYHIYKNKKGVPDCCAGHSLGEITALYASEVLSFQDALIYIQKRAECMHEAGIKNQGRMLAVLLKNPIDIDAILHSSENLTIANFNSKNQIILSGDIKAIDNAILLCKKNKIRTIALPVSGAFHSPLMKPASDALQKTINQLNFDDAIMPIYQNVNALPEKKGSKLKLNIAQQIIKPVNWQDTITNMIRDGVSSFFEIGPKNILLNLMKNIDKDKEVNSFEKLHESI